MLTIKNDNWLYDIGGTDEIALCRGATPEFFCQTNPTFINVCEHVVSLSGAV
jgi:hypothetical protein